LNSNRKLHTLVDDSFGGGDDGAFESPIRQKDDSQLKILESTNSFLEDSLISSTNNAHKLK